MSLSNDGPTIPSNVTCKDTVPINFIIMANKQQRPHNQLYIKPFIVGKWRVVGVQEKSGERGGRGKGGRKKLLMDGKREKSGKLHNNIMLNISQSQKP